MSMCKVVQFEHKIYILHNFLGFMWLAKISKKWYNTHGRKWVFAVRRTFCKAFRFRIVRAQSGILRLFNQGGNVLHCESRRYCFAAQTRFRSRRAATRKKGGLAHCKKLHISQA